MKCEMMCCYYPTTAVAIDDDVDFLRVMTQHLGIEDCSLYSSANKAIEFLKNQQPFKRIQSRILNSGVAPESIKLNPEDQAFLLNIRALHNEIYSEDRFKDVSVLIVDYHMKELNGIEVCEALSNHPAKKILLTGGDDKEKVAIEAFNKGVIHRFISKSDSNFPNLLKQAILMLKESYFRDLTSTLLPYTAANVLNHPSYINFTRKLQYQFSAIEHYQLDFTGSSILLDAAGTPTWFIVNQDSEINNFKNLALNQDADSKVLQTLTSREKIPFFFSDADFQEPVSEWDKCLYPAQPFPGINDYYYSIHTGHIRDNLFQDKIISYKAFSRVDQDEI